jgi:predicted regulator of Ras-like GTPase activity (Roadblock/LC7/MglB family)
MGMQGKVYQLVEVECAAIKIADSAKCRVVEVVGDDGLILSFLIRKDADANEVALRTANILNQSKFVEGSIRCVVIEAP